MKRFRRGEKPPKAGDIQKIMDRLQTRIMGGRNINVRTFGNQLIIERRPAPRRREREIYLLVMVLCSSVREEDAGDTYPVYNNIYDGSWTTDLAGLETTLANHEKSRVCLIGVKRENAHNRASGSTYTTGIDMCYPDDWDIPSWLRTEEWEVAGDCGLTPTTDLTLEDLRRWYRHAVARFGTPKHVAVESCNDCGSVLYDEHQQLVSPFALYSDVDMVDGIPEPVSETNYYSIIQHPEHPTNYQAVEDFYDYVEDDLGIGTLPRHAGFQCRAFDTPDGHCVDKAGTGHSWLGEVSDFITAYVPAL